MTATTIRAEPKSLLVAAIPGIALTVVCVGPPSLFWKSMQTKIVIDRAKMHGRHTTWPPEGSLNWPQAKFSCCFRASRVNLSKGM